MENLKVVLNWWIGLRSSRAAIDKVAARFGYRQESKVVDRREIHGHRAT